MAKRIVSGGIFCIGTMLFLIQQRTATGEECASGMTSFGYTKPRGDIVIKIGSDLVINCTLNSGQHTHNSSQLFWSFGREELNGTSVLILNDYTAQLRIPNAPKAHFTAYCRLRSATGAIFDICRNKVHVGAPPPENVPINCTAYDFKNITCDWQLPPQDDLVPTDWEFKYKKYKNCSQRVRSTMIGRSIHGSFCASQTPCFVLIGTSKLGRSVSSYWFNHYHNVVLSAPERLNCTKVTDRTAFISWDDNSKYKTCAQAFTKSAPYKDSVYSRIIVKEKNKGVVYDMITTRKSLELTNLVPLTEYDVEIRCRFVINGFQNSWSHDSRRVQFRTEPSVPDKSPVNVVGDIAWNSIQKNVTLYWTGIPKAQHFGKDFRYSISTPWNNSSVTTTKTYFRYSNLSTNLAYKFKVQAENEMGVSEEVSYFYTMENQTHEELDLKVEDVIFQHTQNDTWSYTLSWKVANHKVYKLALYWCRGKDSGDGLIQCDDAGIHLQRMVSSKDANSTFNLSNPTSQELHFGVATMQSTQRRRILWSRCSIPSSRKPRPPQFNPLNVGPTWVYLSWKHPKCEERPAYFVGYKIYVNRSEMQEYVTYSVNSDVTAYNVTDLPPNAAYSFAISTVTSATESDVEERTLPTLQSSKQSLDDRPDALSLLGIILPITVLGSLLLCVGCALYKRFRLSIYELNNIQLPTGLTEEYHKQDSSLIAQYNPDKVVGYYTRPLNKIKEPWETSRSWYGFGHYGFNIGRNDDVSPVSSPTASSPGTIPPDSGIALETPCWDVRKPLFDFGNIIDTPETSIAPTSGYSKAIIVDSFPLSHPDGQRFAIRNTNQKPTDYSKVGGYVTSTVTSALPSTAFEACGYYTQASNYVQIGAFSSPEESTDAQDARYPQQPQSAALSSNLGDQTNNAQIYSVDDAIHLSELGKESAKGRNTKNLKLNSVADISCAQLPTTTGYRTHSWLHESNFGCR